MRRFLALALAALFWTSQTEAVPVSWAPYPGSTAVAIGTPVELGKKSQTVASNPTTVSVTTINDAPAGQTNVIFTDLDQLGGGSIWGASVNNDSAGNAYSAAGGGGAWYNQNITHLANGGTFSGTWAITFGSGGSTTAYLIGYTVSGLQTSGGISSIGNATGTSTSPSVTEGTVTATHRIIFCVIFVTNGATATLTPGSGWTEATGSPVTLSSFSAYHILYNIVNTAVSQACSATLSSSLGWAASVSSYPGF